jgi:hypothetical protein
VHDGTLEVGPRTGGGFRVRARLPLSRERVSGGRSERTERTERTEGMPKAGTS